MEGRQSKYKCPRLGALSRSPRGARSPEHRQTTCAAMTRALPIAIVVTITAGTIYAKSASEELTSFERCFQLARDADMVCYAPANGPAERLDCLERARAAQLLCLEQIPANQSAGPKAPFSGTVQSELPNDVTSGMPPTGSSPEATA